jgi:hypothetical protein
MKRLADIIDSCNSSQFSMKKIKENMCKINEIIDLLANIEMIQGYGIKNTEVEKELISKVENKIEFFYISC